MFFEKFVSAVLNSNMAKLAIIIVAVYLIVTLVGAAVLWWPMRWGLDHNRAIGFSVLQLWVTFWGFVLALLGGGLTVFLMGRKPDLLVTATQSFAESGPADQSVEILHLSVVNVGTGVAKAFLISFGALHLALKPSVAPDIDEEKWLMKWMAKPDVEYTRIDSHASAGIWTVQKNFAQFNNLGQLPCFPGGTPTKIEGLGLKFSRLHLGVPTFGIPYTLETDGKRNSGTTIVAMPQGTATRNRG